jgi:hypothetical protein
LLITSHFHVVANSIGNPDNFYVAPATNFDAAPAPQHCFPVVTNSVEDPDHLHAAPAQNFDAAPEHCSHVVTNSEGDRINFMRLRPKISMQLRNTVFM